MLPAIVSGASVLARRQSNAWPLGPAIEPAHSVAPSDWLARRLVWGSSLSLKSRIPAHRWRPGSQTQRVPNRAPWLQRKPRRLRAKQVKLLKLLEPAGLLCRGLAHRALGVLPVVFSDPFGLRKRFARMSRRRPSDWPWASHNKHASSSLGNAKISSVQHPMIDPRKPLPQRRKQESVKPAGRASTPPFLVNKQAVLINGWRLVSHRAIRAFAAMGLAVVLYKARHVFSNHPHRVNVINHFKRCRPTVSVAPPANSRPRGRMVLARKTRPNHGRSAVLCVQA